MTQSFSPGMKELGDIVAGLYKDVKLLKECSWLGGAQKYASKHKDWKATKEDIIGPRGVPDGVDEILVRDKKGNIRVINGFTVVPSKHAERQAYLSDVERWDDAALDEEGITEPSRRRARKGRPRETMKQYLNNELYNYTPALDNQGQPTGQWVLPNNSLLQSKASGYLRGKSSPHPRNIFRRLVKPIWDKVKVNFAPGTPTDVILGIYRIWFNGEYTNHVIRPVLEHMHITADSIPDKKALTHITSSAAFKNNALYYLATQIPPTLSQTIEADLAQLIHSSTPIQSRIPNEPVNEADFTE